MVYVKRWYNGPERIDIMEVSELLEAIREGFLFNMDRRHRRGLCESRITDDLRHVFSEKGCLLSELASVESLVKGKEWRIADGENRYIVAQVRDFIRVRQDIPTMTRTELARKLGKTPGAITRLHKGSLLFSKEMADTLVDNLWVSDWLAEQIMFCAAKDELKAIESRRDRALDIMVRRKYTGYPKVLKWIIEQTKEE